MSQTGRLETPAPGPPLAHVPTGRDVDVVVPVHNEEAALEPSIRRLHRFLSEACRFGWRIVIADNASTDRTPDVARRLRGVEYLRLERKGRGGALRAAWSRSDARVVAYMDVDLSTDLRALLPLVARLLSGHSDVAIGSRLANGARVVRGPKREVISRRYNRLLHATLRTRFSDAQCGFKAVRRDALDGVLGAVRDDAWFFDTELLVVAQRRGLRIRSGRARSPRARPGPARSRAPPTTASTRWRAWPTRPTRRPTAATAGASRT